MSWNFCTPRRLAETIFANPGSTLHSPALTYCVTRVSSFCTIRRKRRSPLCNLSQVLQERRRFVASPYQLIWMERRTNATVWRYFCSVGNKKDLFPSFILTTFTFGTEKRKLFCRISSCTRLLTRFRVRVRARVLRDFSTEQCVDFSYRIGQYLITKVRRKRKRNE